MKRGLQIRIPVVLFLVACCVPSLEFNGDKGVDVMFGARAFAVGWSGIFAEVMGWYANPVGVLALLLLFLKKRTVAVIVGAIAVAIAFSVLNDIGRQLPGDEGGVTHTYIARVLPGFYIWIGSLAAIPLLALVPVKRLRQPPV